MEKFLLSKPPRPLSCCSAFKLHWQEREKNPSKLFFTHTSFYEHQCCDLLVKSSDHPMSSAAGSLPHISFTKRRTPTPHAVHCTEDIPLSLCCCLIFYDCLTYIVMFTFITGSFSKNSDITVEYQTR